MGLGYANHLRDFCDDWTAFSESYVRTSEIHDTAAAAQTIDAAIVDHNNSFAIPKLQWNQRCIPGAATADKAVSAATADARLFHRILQHPHDRDGFLRYLGAILSKAQQAETCTQLSEKRQASSRVQSLQEEQAQTTGQQDRTKLHRTATADEAARAQTDTELPMQATTTAGRDAQQNLPTTATADEAARAQTDTELPTQTAIMAGRDAQQNFPTTATADKAARAQTDTELLMQTAIAAGRDAHQNLPTTATADKAARAQRIQNCPGCELPSRLGTTLNEPIQNQPRLTKLRKLKRIQNCPGCELPSRLGTTLMHGAHSEKRWRIIQFTTFDKSVSRPTILTSSKLFECHRICVP